MRRIEKQALLNERCLNRWGITYSHRAEIRSQFGKLPFSAFVEQRKNAKKRGIAFHFIFAQWWQIWQDSGHWEHRGRQLGANKYVMSRIADQGAYEPGNVRILTQSDNMLEFHHLHVLTTSGRARRYSRRT